ncbi:MAG: hypothetical protein U0L11_10455 [Acutalibacteraceae bacterium]|nr:hypothetical protein [Acutalibacteraceae bacterium]
MLKNMLKIDENEMENLISTADIRDLENESVYLCGYTKSYVVIDDDGEEMMGTEQCRHSFVMPSEDDFEEVYYSIVLSLVIKVIEMLDYDTITFDRLNCRVRKKCENECAEYHDFFVSSEIPKDLVKKILRNKSN